MSSRKPCSNCREAKVRCSPSEDSPHAPCARCARKALACVYPNARSSPPSFDNDPSARPAFFQPAPPPIPGQPIPALPYTGPPPMHTRPRYSGYPANAYPQLAISPHFTPGGAPQHPRHNQGSWAGQPAGGYDAYLQAYTNPQEVYPARLAAVLAGEVEPGMPLGSGRGGMHMMSGAQQQGGSSSFGAHAAGGAQMPMYSAAGRGQRWGSEEMVEEDSD
ncbi:Zn(2)-C6 fungal-type domain-containing protein [Mycena kentingensis (nom. inval.)]|nr:Zn(2)-C6 fungal-type domain-containing protein [Mycena kentingensis (nom. inval.)]